MTPISSKYLGETILEKYLLEQVLDIKPRGTVFRGVHLAMKRPVEVTLIELSPEFGSDQRAGFEKRAAATSQLSHPGVARIYDFGRHEDEFLYRVEEHLEGVTLFELCSTARAPDLPTLLEIMLRLIEILEAVHQQSLYHLHLTPSELVFLDDEITADTLRVHHFTGVPWGTNPEAATYAAPEQFNGDDVGARADVYAVGLVLWFALVGAPAVTGSEMLARQVHLSSPAWRLPPNINCPPLLAKIVHQALAKPQEQRYASMHELHLALKSVRDQWDPEATALMSDSEATLREQTPFPIEGDIFAETYAIEHLLGSGSFARVYAARNVIDGGRVALKILWRGANDTSLREDPEATTRRFEREARLVGMLECPHTVTLLGFGVSEDGLLYQALEFIDGLDLKAWLEKHGPLTPEQAAELLGQLLSSLHEAHERGILHRDIKPANVMVTEDNGVLSAKLVDFGIAKVLNEVLGVTVTDLTATGTAPGTPRYMSPEQLRGDPLGPASDLYSLGLVALELVTGQQAIRGDSAYEIIANHLSEKEITVPVDVIGAPALCQVINKMVRKDPDERYQSAGEVMRALVVTTRSEDQG